MAKSKGLISRFAVVAALVSCSSDPSLLTDGRGGDPRRAQSGTEPDPAGAQAQGEMPKHGAADAGGSPVDAGALTDAQLDARVDASADAAPAVNAFTGAGAFIATLGPSARKPTHNFAGNTPPTSPAKQACLGCHVAGGAAVAFAFGGTAFKDDAGTIPAPGIEVRVRAPDGGAISAYTDADGNFYQPTATAFPANVGVRNAAGTRVMMGAPPDGNCNASQCHGSAHPWVNLP